MKKWIALLLSCVMLLAMVAGCGGTPAESPSQSGGAGETAPQSAAPDGETKTYKVGFSNVWVGNTWGVQCVNELEAYLRNNEQISEYYIYNADNDVNKQISDIEDLIAKGVDMLILQPICRICGGSGRRGLRRGNCGGKLYLPPVGCYR